MKAPNWVKLCWRRYAERLAQQERDLRSIGIRGPLQAQFYVTDMAYAANGERWSRYGRGLIRAQGQGARKEELFRRAMDIVDRVSIRDADLLARLGSK